MKRLSVPLFMVLVNLTTLPLLAQNNSFIKDYLERLESSRNYLMEVAEIMPEDKYGFKASSESMTFAENLMHIGGAMNWHCKTLLGGQDPKDYERKGEFDVGNTSKEAMIATLNRTFDEAIKFIKQFNTAQCDDRLDYFGLDRTKRQIFWLLADHITHHRGQMLVYLRLNGLVPPRYVLFQ